MIQKVKSRIIPTVLVKTAAYTLKADEALYGAVISNLGATAEVVISLPAAVPGMRVTAVVQAAYLLSLDPVDADVIYDFAGLVQSAGVAIKGNAVGEYITLTCLQAGKWVTTSFNGVWDEDAS